MANLFVANLSAVWVIVRSWAILPICQKSGRYGVVFKYLFKKHFQTSDIQ